VDDRIIVVKGTVNCKEEEAPKILADKIFDIEDFGVAKGQKPVKLRIPDSMDEEIALHDIKELLCSYPGDCPVLIYSAASGRCFKVDTKLWIDPSEDFYRELEAFIGKENIKL
jgi:DNA polymerase-3 subunit alpha